jgi:hypothetical protein
MAGRFLAAASSLRREPEKDRGGDRLHRPSVSYPPLFPSESVPHPELLIREIGLRPGPFVGGVETFGRLGKQKVTSQASVVHPYVQQAFGFFAYVVSKQKIKSLIAHLGW